MSRDAKKYAKLEKLHEQGKITYNQLVARGNAILVDQQAACQHTETEEDNGTIWCANDSCGMRLSG
jgi:hypothetical protein